MISVRLAGNIMLALLALLAVFHVLVLAHVLPTDIVWAGQAGESPGDLVVMETVALIITLLFMAMVVVRLGYVWIGCPRIVTSVSMWAICVFFLLNTVGNLASSVSVENLIFAPLTIILVLLALRLAVSKR